MPKSKFLYNLKGIELKLEAFDKVLKKINYVSTVNGKQHTTDGGYFEISMDESAMYTLFKQRLGYLKEWYNEYFTPDKDGNYKKLTNDGIEDLKFEFKYLMYDIDELKNITHPGIKNQMYVRHINSVFPEFVEEVEKAIKYDYDVITGINVDEPVSLNVALKDIAISEEEKLEHDEIEKMDEIKNDYNRVEVELEKLVAKNKDIDENEREIREHNDDFFTYLDDKTPQEIIDMYSPYIESLEKISERLKKANPVTNAEEKFIEGVAKVVETNKKRMAEAAKGDKKQAIYAICDLRNDMGEFTRLFHDVRESLRIVDEFDAPYRTIDPEEIPIFLEAADLIFLNELIRFDRDPLSEKNLKRRIAAKVYYSRELPKHNDEKTIKSFVMNMHNHYAHKWHLDDEENDDIFRILYGNMSEEEKKNVASLGGVEVGELYNQKIADRDRAIKEAEQYAKDNVHLVPYVKLVASYNKEFVTSLKAIDDEDVYDKAFLENIQKEYKKFGVEYKKVKRSGNMTKECYESFRTFLTNVQSLTTEYLESLEKLSVFTEGQKACAELCVNLTQLNNIVANDENLKNPNNAKDILALKYLYAEKKGLGPNENLSDVGGRVNKVKADKDFENFCNEKSVGDLLDIARYDDTAAADWLEYIVPLDEKTLENTIVDEKISKKEEKEIAAAEKEIMKAEKEVPADEKEIPEEKKEVPAEEKEIADEKALYTEVDGVIKELVDKVVNYEANLDKAAKEVTNGMLDAMVNELNQEEEEKVKAEEEKEAADKRAAKQFKEFNLQVRDGKTYYYDSLDEKEYEAFRDNYGNYYYVDAEGEENMVGNDVIPKPSEVNVKKVDLTEEEKIEVDKKAIAYFDAKKNIFGTGYNSNFTFYTTNFKKAENLLHIYSDELDKINIENDEKFKEAKESIHIILNLLNKNIDVALRYSLAIEEKSLVQNSHASAAAASSMNDAINKISDISQKYINDVILTDEKLKEGEISDVQANILKIAYRSDTLKILAEKCEPYSENGLNIRKIYEVITAVALENIKDKDADMRNDAIKIFSDVKYRDKIFGYLNNNKEFIDVMNKEFAGENNPENVDPAKLTECIRLARESHTKIVKENLERIRRENYKKVAKETTHQSYSTLIDELKKNTDISKVTIDTEKEALEKHPGLSTFTGSLNSSELLYVMEKYLTGVKVGCERISHENGPLKLDNAKYKKFLNSVRQPDYSMSSVIVKLAAALDVMDDLEAQKASFAKSLGDNKLLSYAQIDQLYMFNMIDSLKTAREYTIDPENANIVARQALNITAREELKANPELIFDEKTGYKELLLNTTKLNDSVSSLTRNADVKRKYEDIARLHLGAKQCAKQLGIKSHDEILGDSLKNDVANYSKKSLLRNLEILENYAVDANDLSLQKARIFVDAANDKTKVSMQAGVDAFTNLCASIEKKFTVDYSDKNAEKLMKNLPDVIKASKYNQLASILKDSRIDIDQNLEARQDIIAFKILCGQIETGKIKDRAAVADLLYAETDNKNPGLSSQKAAIKDLINQNKVVIDNLVKAYDVKALLDMDDKNLLGEFNKAIDDINKKEQELREKRLKEQREREQREKEREQREREAKVQQEKDFLAGVDAERVKEGALANELQEDAFALKDAEFKGAEKAFMESKQPRINEHKRMIDAVNEDNSNSYVVYVEVNGDIVVNLQNTEELIGNLAMNAAELDMAIKKKNSPEAVLAKQLRKLKDCLAENSADKLDAKGKIANVKVNPDMQAIMENIELAMDAASKCKSSKNNIARDAATKLENLRTKFINDMKKPDMSKVNKKIIEEEKSAITGINNDSGSEHLTMMILNTSYKFEASTMEERGKFNPDSYAKYYVQKAVVERFDKNDNQLNFVNKNTLDAEVDRFKSSAAFKLFAKIMNDYQPNHGDLGGRCVSKMDEGLSLVESRLEEAKKLQNLGAADIEKFKNNTEKKILDQYSKYSKDNNAKPEDIKKLLASKMELKDYVSLVMDEKMVNYADKLIAEKAPAVNKPEEKAKEQDLGNKFNK